MQFKAYNSRKVTNYGGGMLWGGKRGGAARDQGRSCERVTELLRGGGEDRREAGGYIGKGGREKAKKGG